MGITLMDMFGVHIKTLEFWKNCYGPLIRGEIRSA